MKRFLAVLVACAVAALPATAPAAVPVPASLVYDDGDFEASSQLDLFPSADLSIPALPVPVVEFAAPTADIYALGEVKFYLLQVPDDPTATPETLTYPVTVQIWNQAVAPSTGWVPGEFFNADLDVTQPGWYTLDMKGESVTFTGTIRVGIFLRDDSTVPIDPVLIPAIPVHLGLDTDGEDSIDPKPFGKSFLYDPTLVPPADWAMVSGNHGMQVSIVPALGCRGFLPPFNRTIRMNRGGRTIPLKAFLFDSAGEPVTSSLLTAPPLVGMLWAPDASTTPIDVTDFVAPAGRSNIGQAFRSACGGKWLYNLKTNKSLPSGIYTVQFQSGDETEYAVDPTCTGTFVIDGPRPRRGPMGRR